MALRTADSAVGAPRPRPRPEIAEIVDYGANDPLWLRARHGIVAHLSGSDWARGWNRRHWLLRMSRQL